MQGYRACRAYVLYRNHLRYGVSDISCSGYRNGIDSFNSVLLPVQILMQCFVFLACKIQNKTGRQKDDWWYMKIVVVKMPKLLSGIVKSVLKMN